ncbi:hypothetical protein F183_A41040 [Bryobacterales bacterium F-183]|nr:hypothetical protein F183_A41040 [Bryobacterales bacterium F-183]
MRFWSTPQKKSLVYVCTLSAGLIAASSQVLPAATLPKLSGAIAGHVRNSSGIAQMGATVAVYNRYEKLIRQVLTNDKGAFYLDGLSPDSYSVRVSLASFVPALKRGIAVQAGADRVLNVNLTSIFSSIELAYEAPSSALMTDDWKWSLRTALATRPVLRALPGMPTYGGVSTSKRADMFTETRGLVNVSAGDPSSMGSNGTQTDLGTAFALATSIYGRNEVQLSGNLGLVPNAALPAAGFRSTYKRVGPQGASPTITVTARQLYMPTRGAFQQSQAPAMRTLSVSSVDKVEFSDRLSLDYGFSLDSVAFVDRLNYFSPFAKLSYSLGDLGLVQFGYSSGAPAAEWMQNSATEGASNAELRRDLAALALLPRVSLRNGRANVQRSQNLEISYQREVGKKTTVSAAAFRENMRNAAVNLDAPSDIYTGDALPDFGSRAAMFNVGNFDRTGFMGAVSHRVTDQLEVLFAAGRGGAVTAVRRDLADESAQTLRSVLKAQNRSWASLRLVYTTPRAGTKLTSSYGWTDYTAMMPGHLFLTQKALPETGWNLSVRQPLPAIGLVPGRIELTGEARNMLAQGYMPLQAGSRRILLIQSPRALRGGLSFIF